MEKKSQRNQKHKIEYLRGHSDRSTFTWTISSFCPRVSLPLSTGRQKQPRSSTFHLSLYASLFPLFCGLSLSRHPFLQPTHCLHLLCSPEGTIFTLTTSINLTLSHAHIHVHRSARRHAYVRLADYASMSTTPLPYQSLALRSLLGDRSLWLLLHWHGKECVATCSDAIYMNMHVP